MSPAAEARTEILNMLPPVTYTQPEPPRRELRVALPADPRRWLLWIPVGVVLWATAAVCLLALAEFARAVIG